MNIFWKDKLALIPDLCQTRGKYFATFGAFSKGLLITHMANFQISIKGVQPYYSPYHISSSTEFL